MPTTIDTSFLDTMPPNVAVQFFDRVTATPDAEAFRFPRGEAWESVTWKQAGDKVEALAAGLIALGVQPEQRVGIASGTRYEWILADLAIMCAAGATTTVYPTTNAEDTVYILGDSESRVVFAEDDEQLAKLVAHRAELPHVSKVVTFDGQGRRRLGDLARRPRRDGRAEARRAARRRAHDVRGDRSRPARDPDLHLRHDRPSQGRAAAPLVVGLRGRGHPRAGHPLRDRPRVPLAADGALLRQGAHVDADGVRLRRRDRRPRRQDRRQPGRREAHVHGCCAAHLREGPRPHRHHAGRRGRGQGEALQGRLRHRPRGRAPQARGQVGADRAQGQARPVRQAGLQQGPRPLRWTRPLLHLRCRGAQPRHRRVVRRGRHHHPRGLRPDRDLGRAPS